MGYIFDAMNRAGQGASATPSSPGAMPPSPSSELKPQDPADALAAVEAVSQAANAVAAAAEAVTADGAGEATVPAELDLTQEELAASRQLPPDERIVSLAMPSSLFGEEYRAIRTSILARWQQKRQLVHTITSATPQEGKTITSLNLGLCFSELKSRRTIVLEADLRMPQFANLLGIDPNKPGLIALLEGKIDLASAIVEVGPSKLPVIPAGGRLNEQAVQMLSGRPMIELLKVLRRKFDHVIIDTPPVVELADAGILGAMSDDVMLVVRMNRTPRTLVDIAIRTLGSYNAPVGGLIATDHQPYRRWYYKRYGYYYNYGSNEDRARRR